MASPQGRIAHIGFSKESTFGTPVAASTYMRFISESLVSDIEMVVPANITGVPDEGPSYNGLKTHQGKVTFNAFPDSLGHWLSMAVGADSITDFATVSLTATPDASAGTLTAGTYYARVVSVEAGGAVVYTKEASVTLTTNTEIVYSWAADVSETGGYRVYIGKVSSGVYELGYITVAHSTTTVTYTGSNSMTTSTPIPAEVYTHKFKPRMSDFSDLSFAQPYTLEVHKDLGAAFQFSGCIANKLLLKFGVGKGRGADMVLTAEADMLMKTVADLTATTPSFETPLPFLWNQAAIKVGGVSFTTLQDLSIEIDNGLEAYPFIDGTDEIQRILSRAMRVVTVTGAMIADRDQWAAFTAGTQQDLNVVFTGATLGGGHYTLTIDMPLLRYYKYPIPVPGPQLIMVTFDARAKYDPNDVSDTTTTPHSNGTPIVLTLGNDRDIPY